MPRKQRKAHFVYFVRPNRKHALSNFSNFDEKVYLLPFFQKFSKHFFQNSHIGAVTWGTNFLKWSQKLAFDHESN